MIKEDDIFPIGKFQKTHALKGELNAFLDIDPEFLDEDYALIVDVDGIFVPFYVESWRNKGSMTVLLKLDGVDSEEEARKFVNKTIYANRKDVSEFVGDEDIHAVDGLVGYELIDSPATPVGRIVAINDTTANVLMEVEREDGTEIYVPLAEDLILEIDDADKRIVMNLPEGLMEI